MITTQVITTKAGDYSVLKLQSISLEEPKENEVQIKILATGISWADVMIRRESYPGMPKLPLVQGYDFVGEVIRLGSKVDNKWLNQKVAAIIQWGSYSQYITISTDQLIMIPDNVAINDVACLSLNYVTAYQILVHKANVKEGDTVLIHGASGGVGSALIQLAKSFKLKIYATASKDKLAAITGDDIIGIDYKLQDFETFIKAKEPDGINAYFDVGGGKTFDKSYKLLKKGGTGITFGFLEITKMAGFIGLMLKMGFRNLFSNKKVLMYSIIKEKKRNNAAYIADFKTLITLLQAKKIKPIIAKEISLSEVPIAHKEFEKHTFVGKVIINPHK